MSARHLVCAFTKHGFSKPCFFICRIFVGKFEHLSIFNSVTSAVPENSSRPIRLLVVVNVVRPDLGGGVLFSDLFEGLVERGIHVTVKCAYSYYPEWEDKSGKNGLHIESVIESGVHVERHGLYIPRNPNNFLQRLLYEASFFLSLRRRMPAHGEFDAIMVFCPLIGSVAYATAVKSNLNVPLWLNVQDLSAQAAVAGGITGRSMVADILLRVQNRLFGHADLWTSISEPMIQALEKHNPNKIPVRYAPNWLHPSLAGFIESALQSRAQSSDTVLTSGTKEKVIRLFYSGNIGSKQNLLQFCKQLSRLPIQFSFRIQGAGGRVAELKKWIESTSDDRFVLFPLSDEESLARTLVECDYYVITEKPDSGNSFIPSKLIPAITSRTPVLAVCDVDSPLGKEMRDHRLGSVLDWDSLSGPTDLPATLERAMIPDDAYSRWQNNCANRAQFYNREAAIDRYVSILAELLAGKEDKTASS